MIELATVVRKSASQVSCSLDNEVAILELKAALYYGLNEVGAHIWELLDEPRSVDGICGAIEQRFDVEKAACRADVMSFLGSMQEAGLIEAVN